jgi:hypothetical protein
MRSTNRRAVEAAKTAAVKTAASTMKTATAAVKAATTAATSMAEGHCGSGHPRCERQRRSDCEKLFPHENLHTPLHPIATLNRWPVREGGSMAKRAKIILMVALQHEPFAGRRS